MHRSTLAAALLALGMLLPSTALAQDLGADEVTLKNGGSIRGTVVETEPGARVKIIELGETVARVVPWSDVANVEKGKHAPRPAQPGPPAATQGAPARPPAMGDPGVVRLHVESPEPATVVVQRETVVVDGTVLSDPSPVCAAPCGVVVDGTPGHVFKLSSDRFLESSQFSFTGMTGDVTLRVLRTGSRARIKGGAASVGIGLGSMILAAVLLPMSAQNDLQSASTGLRAAGIGALVGGAGLVGLGIGLVATGLTKLRIEPRDGTPAREARIAPRYWMGEF